MVSSMKYKKIAHSTEVKVVRLKINEKYFCILCNYSSALLVTESCRDLQGWKFFPYLRIYFKIVQKIILHHNFWKQS